MLRHYYNFEKEKKLSKNVSIRVKKKSYIGKNKIIFIDRKNMYTNILYAMLKLFRIFNGIELNQQIAIYRLNLTNSLLR